MRRVNPSLYTKRYYLFACNGYGCFKKSYGKKLDAGLLRIIQNISIRKGQSVLDVGSGRGEVCFWAAGQGANAVGIDYSKEAVKLAQKARYMQSGSIKKRTRFLLMDAKKLSFSSNTFDLVFMIEVLEHLYPEEQKRVLLEIRRVLKNDGVLLLHTAPTKWFNDFTYRFWCYPVSWLLTNLWNGITGRKYPGLQPPKRIRGEYDKLLHVGESDYLSLRHLLRNTGFKGKIRSTNITVIKPFLSWKDALFNFLVYLYPLSNTFPFDVFWGNDLIAVLTKS